MAQSIGLLTKGIKLSYATITSGTVGTYTDLDDLQAIPDVGGSRDSIETTTLADDSHRYINGLIDYGDSLDFTFLYGTTNFDTVAGLSETTEYSWKITFPGEGSSTTGNTCTFKGMPHVRVNGVGVNEVITYTLSVKPTSAFTFA